MSGYKISPEEINRIGQDEDAIIEELGQAILDLQNIQEDMLSDVNWQGPKKSEFERDFVAYLEAASALKQSGDAQVDALLNILSTYVNAEM